MSERHAALTSLPPILPRLIRRFAVVIVLLWLGFTAFVNLAVPQLEVVGKAHSVSMSPSDAASIQAIKRVGQVFGEFDSDNAVTIVLEGDQPLGGDAHRFYSDLMRKLSADTRHVAHIQDFWGDPLTAAGSQSADDRAAYVVVYLVGNNETEAYDSVHAVRHMVDTTPPPHGVKAYVTGPAALNADQAEAGDKSIAKVTAITSMVIAAMLLVIYRSVITAVLVLIMVGIDLGAIRGFIALLADHNIFSLSTFATNLLVLMAIAASTDYAIFMLGRYHESRYAGEDRETAFYTMFHGTAHVILGSGLTIAGAMYCLSFARLPYFETLGAPIAIGMLVAVLAALTLGPAVLTVGSFFKLFDPKRRMNTRRWRRVGTAIVRWPGPVLAATCLVASIGLLALPSYRTTYDLRKFMPASMPSNVGDAAAGRHFSRARLNPEVLLIETDHDMRNPVDMLVLDKVAKNIYHSPGIEQVKAITRPLGTTIKHTSIPFIISMQGVNSSEQMEFMKDRIDDILVQVAAMNTSIETMHRMYALMGEVIDNTVDMDHLTHDMSDITATLRDHLADFEDFFRPIRSYFYWEKHCFDVPLCWSIRSIFDMFDSVDQLSEKLEYLVKDMDILITLLPQMRAQMPPMISAMTTMRDMMLIWHGTLGAFYKQQERNNKDPGAMGRVFDAAQIDDSFYLPQSAFENPDFKRGLKMFLSPDGKAARFVIALEGDPATPEGISRVEPIKREAREAHKGNSIAGRCDLSGWHRGDVQGYSRGRQIRSADRRSGGDKLDFDHHDDHHPKCGSRSGYRGYRRAFHGRLFRAFRIGLAGHSGYRVVLDGVGDVGDPAPGGGIRLQSAADFPVERGNWGRIEHRNYPCHGWYRGSGDGCRHGVRRYHVVVCVQRFADYWSDRYHHRPGLAVRHPRRALVHDTVHCCAAGTLVLVAATGAPAPGQSDASAVRAAPIGSRLVAAVRPAPVSDWRP